MTEETRSDPAAELDPASTSLSRLALVAILLVGACLRLAHLGGPSLYYDEVVTMELARAPNPVRLLRLMDRIDASRAPLQPLLLQAWVKVFGPSDLAGRLFSAVCGILTLVVVHEIGRRVFDRSTGLWAAWLAALSPALVRYSQEVRMYAWLVLLTCLSWAVFFSFRHSAPLWKRSAYTLCLAALVYTHPLALFMVAAHALAYVASRPALRLTWRDWLATQVVAVLLMAPWLPQYLRNRPSYIVGRQPIRLLLGLPIEYIGGNSLALLGCAALIAWGLRSRDGLRLDRPRESLAVLIWFLVPPVLLYGLSLVSHPVFGLARYTLFVAPAYLLLVARGISKLPMPPRYLTALVGMVLSAMLLRTMVYDNPDPKADWRSAAALIARTDPRATVVPLSPIPENSYVDVDTARYYLGPEIKILATSTLLGAGGTRALGDSVWVAARVRDGRLLQPLPAVFEREYRPRGRWDFPGLRLFWFTRLLTLTDFRFEIPDSRMTENLVLSNVLESGMSGIWNRIRTGSAGM